MLCTRQVRGPNMAMGSVQQPKSDRLTERTGYSPQEGAS